MRSMTRLAPIAVMLGVVTTVACSDKERPPPLGDGWAIGTGGTSGTGTGGSAGLIQIDPNDTPTTCQQAEENNSYIGCDYWPTVTANSVWSIFDFAVVVSNTGTSEAAVHVTGNGVDIEVSVPPNTLETIYLPWVPSLKGPDANECGGTEVMTASVLQSAGAYHLVSSHPVTVYQFSALEYRGAGGPPGKSWTGCPGNSPCPDRNNAAVGCFSFSNDASLLLPTTALTGNYRLIGSNGEEVEGYGGLIPSFAAITAVRDGTLVEVKTKGKVLAGGGIPAMQPGDTAQVTMNAGDVLELIGGKLSTDDLSGSLVVASQPVQVITGMACRDEPAGSPACDHLEESVFPAETLGRRYAVTVPHGPRAAVAPGQVVRLVGNVDDTTLTFDPAVNEETTLKIGAGEVIDLGVQAGDFQVTGDHEFLVATFMLGATLVDAPLWEKGDPSQSLATSVEQYRQRYVFLAPRDYDTNFVNIVAEPGTRVNLDGTDVAATSFTAIGGSGLSVARVGLGPTGTHTLKADRPVGVQVYGYGSYTSYQYPGGLNLKSIAPPPPK